MVDQGQLTHCQRVRRLLTTRFSQNPVLFAAIIGSARRIAAMPQSAVLKITLSEEDLDLVRRIVESGECRSESDVIAALLEDRRELERERIRFEQEEVIPALEEYLSDPSSAISLDQVRQNIAERRRQLKAN